MSPTKACPIVVRERGGATELLVFRHPLAGVQWVKGTIEAGESSRAAAIRELWEEAGVQATGVLADLGHRHAPDSTQIWAYHLMQTRSDLPAAWSHWTEDDGGLQLEFFWHPMDEAPSDEWHPAFVAAWPILLETLGFTGSPSATAPATPAASSR